MWTWIIIIFAAAFVLAIVFRKKLPFIKDLAEPSSPKSDPSSFASTVFLKAHFRGTTPKGVQVYSYMADVSASCRQLIDEGMQRTFNVAYEAGFTQKLNHTDYFASVWPRSNKCLDPGFLMEGWNVATVDDQVPNKNYDQTPVDKNPAPGQYAVCVAGEFRLYTDLANPERGAVGVPCISVVDDPGMTYSAARYETEHAVLWFNDPARFEATKIHSEGSGHPILPDKNEAQRLAAVPYKCGGASER